MFLLVWDKDSYTGSFLVMFSCIYIYYNPNWFVSSSPLHSFLAPSHDGPNQFKISIFIPVKRINQPHLSF
jgi:cellulose synthase/poly-beta-1,6-N-acetylglucosamine synthase-like glycosyltransferase